MVDLKSGNNRLQEHTEEGQNIDVEGKYFVNAKLRQEQFTRGDPKLHVISFVTSKGNSPSQTPQI